MKLLLLLFLLFFSFRVYSQESVDEYFLEAGKYYDEGKLEDAINIYSYIFKHDSLNTACLRALYEIGEIYSEQKNYDKAIIIYKKVLAYNFPTIIRCLSEFNSLYFDLYRNFSSQSLSDIYYDKYQYDSALYYLQLSDTVYPLPNFCGNSYGYYQVLLSLRYLEVCKKLNAPEKALPLILPKIFTALDYSDTIIEKLKELLLDKKDLKMKLGKSLYEMYSRSKTGLVRYYIKFLDVEIQVGMFYFQNKKKFVTKWGFEKSKREEVILEYKEEIRNNIVNTNFYKMIKELSQ